MTTWVPRSLSRPRKKRFPSNASGREANIKGTLRIAERVNYLFDYCTTLEYLLFFFQYEGFHCKLACHRILFLLAVVFCTQLRLCAPRMKVLFSTCKKAFPDPANSMYAKTNSPLARRRVHLKSLRNHRAGIHSFCYSLVAFVPAPNHLFHFTPAERQLTRNAELGRNHATRFRSTSECGEHVCV